VTAVKFAAVGNAPDPSLVDDFSVVVFALNLSLAVLVHEVNDDALGSVVCHTRRCCRGGS
jgi:hypothetical protein